MMTIKQKQVSRPPIGIVNAFDFPLVNRFKDRLILSDRPLIPYVAERARSYINSGVFFENNGGLISGTNYLQNNLDLVRPEPASCSPLATGGSPLFVIYNAGWRNYYHRLIQGYFTAWLFRTYYGALGGRFMHPQMSSVDLSIMTHFGIDNSSCTFLDPEDRLELENLYFLPPAYGEYAFSPSPLLGQYGQDIASNIAPASRSKRKIYISRRDTGKRKMLNEEALEALLIDKGYEIVSLSGKSFAEQIALFKSAEKIIAPHGAGLANIIFCNPGTQVVELANHTYMNSCFSCIGQVLELDYTVHISSTLKPHRVQSNIQWEADIESLHSLI